MSRKRPSGSLVSCDRQLLWDDEDDTREFWNTTHLLLDGRTPLDVTMAELVARRVEELLWKL